MDQFFLIKILRSSKLHKNPLKGIATIGNCVLLLLMLLYAGISAAFAQTSYQVPVGSFIINMGIVPQTVNNGLKPYGLVYDLIKNNQVPVKWVINTTKAKDGIDFTYNGIPFKGGTFIIPAEYRNASVNAKIASYGVTGTTTTSALTVIVNYNLTSIPNWTLDKANGGVIASRFFVNAGIPTNAYNWRVPRLLSACDDIFVMPHGHPKWSSHGNLYDWNRNHFGSIWAGCHAVSVLENMNNGSVQTNFLANNVGSIGNALVHFSKHSNATAPFLHQNPTSPVAQYMGKTDNAHLQGPEQAYLPVLGGGWRSTTQVIANDPTQANIPFNSPGQAAIIAHGRAFGNSNYGWVMYEGGHDINKDLLPDNIAAQRAFFNFSFIAAEDKVPSIQTANIPSNIVSGIVSNMSVSATSPVGSNLRYSWTSSCGGTFSSSTVANPSFTPPVVSAPTNCIITVTVTDGCGRTRFSTNSVTVLPAAMAPTANNDLGSINATCATSGLSTTLSVLANDVDINNDILTITNVSGNNGTWSHNGSTVTFQPNTGFFGVATATYTVCDPGNLCANATISIQVGSTDVNGCSSSQFYGCILSGSGETVITARSNSITNPNNAIFDQDETLAGFNSLTDSITIQLDDNVLLNDSLNIIWASALNNQQASIRVSVSATEAGPYTVLGNFNRTGTSLGSSFVNNTFGTISYVSIKQVSSNSLDIDAIEFNVKGCVARAPEVYSNALNCIEDSSVLINATGNAIDPLGFALSLKRIVQSPVNGYASINVDGTITYAPKKDVAGEDSLTYEICNAQGYCSIASVFIDIIEDDCVAGSYKPLSSTSSTASFTPYSDGYLDASNPTNSLMNGTTIEVGNRGNSVKRGLMMFRFTGIPANSFVTSANLRLMQSKGKVNKSILSAHYVSQAWDSLNSDASWNERDNSANLAWATVGGTFGSTVQGSAKALVRGNGFVNLNISNLAQNWVSGNKANFGLLIKTAENENKTLAFQSVEFNKTDERPILTVSYLSPLPCRSTPNRAPLAGKDFAVTPAGQQVSIAVVGNDYNVDPSNTFGAPSIILAPSNGSATVSGNAILYTPNVTFNGVEQIRYRICNNNNLCDTGIIEITVTNSGPMALADAVTINSGVTQHIAVKANDNDTDGPSTGAPSIVDDPKNGLATVSGNNIVYTPNPGFFGRDSIIYQICEQIAGACNDAPLCDTAIIYIQVNNQAPIARADTFRVLYCAPVVLSLIGNDSDPEGGPLQITSLSTLSNPFAGTLVNNNDGTVTFDPEYGFTGNVTFSYRIADNGTPALNSSIVTVRIIMFNPTNIAPIVNKDSEVSLMDDVIYLSVLDNDSDPNGHSLTAPTLTKLPVHGTATVLGNGLVEFVPNPGFFGFDTFDYRVCDIQNSATICMTSIGLCNVATGSVIYVAPPNVVFARNDENATNVNTPVSGNLLTNDFDLEGDDILLLGFINGSAYVNADTIQVGGVGVNGNIVANAGSVIINLNGDYTFNPAANFVGTINLPYSISDNAVPEATDTAYLRMSVVPLLPAGNSIIANNDENMSYGAAVSGNVKINDIDPQGDSTELSGFTFDADGDGIQDSAGVLGVARVIGGKTSSGAFTSNAGTIILNANGTYTYTPALDFHGSIDIVYEICDSAANAKCAQATLNIDIIPNVNGSENDAPFAGDDFSLTTNDIAITGNFVQNDLDPNGNPLTLNGNLINSAGPASPIGSPLATVNGGTIQFYANGTYLYTPSENYVGPDSYVYTICDQTNVNPLPLCASASINILVQYLPKANLSVTKTISNPSPTVLDTVTFTMIVRNLGPNHATGVTVTDTVPAGYTFISAQSSAGVWLAPNWTINNLSKNDGDTLTIIATVTSVQNYTNTAIVFGNELDLVPTNNISSITPIVNYLPFAYLDSISVNEDDSVSSTVITNDFLSADGGNTWSLVSNPSHGNLVFNNNGSFTYTPDSNYHGMDEFVYQICDVDNECDTASVIITVNSINDIPVATNDTASTSENSSVLVDVLNNDNFGGDGPLVGPIGLISQGSHGTAIINNGGTINDPTDDKIYYTPNYSYTGFDTLSYQICDLNNDCDTAILVIQVSPSTFAITCDLVSNATCFGSATGRASVVVNGGFAPYTYTWSNGGSDSTNFILMAGNHTVIVSDARMVQRTCSLSVSQPSAIIITSNAISHVTCGGGSNGSIDISAAGGIGSPFTYAWTKSGNVFSANTEDVSALSAGTYFVRAMDAQGCFELDTIHISQPQALEATISSITNLACNLGNEGAIDLSVTGAGAPYTFAWTKSEDVLFTETTQDLEQMGLGSYRVVVSNNVGCTDTAFASIVGGGTQADFAVTKLDCDGNYQLVNNSFGADDYVWDIRGISPAGLDRSVYCTTSDTDFVYSFVPGTYNITLTANNNEGCVDSMTTTLSISVNPLAVFTYESLSCSNQINFSNLSVNGSSYAWNFGDLSSGVANESILINPSHTFTNGGSFPVTLITTDGAGCADTLTRNVQVTPLGSAPVANFTSQVVSGSCVTKVYFTNTSANAASFVWIFPDGSTNNLTNPSKSFPLAGTYSIKLIAISESGCTDTIEQNIVINNNTYGAVAKFVANDSTQCFINNKFNFINQSSYFGTGYISNYKWNFGDGTTNTVNTFIYNKQYANSGLYTVQLISVSPSGCSDTAYQTIRVKPSADPSFNVNIGCGKTATFTHEIDSNATYIWNFGDGNFASHILDSFTHTYANTGNFNITLTTYKENGCSASTSVNKITSDGRTPVANFNYYRACGNNIQFNNLSQSASGFLWNFGDGSPVVSGVEPYHSFPTAGTYNVTLTAFNSPSCLSTITLPVVAPQGWNIRLPRAKMAYYVHPGSNTISAKDSSSVDAQNFKWYLNKIYVGSGNQINIPTGAAGIYELMMIADNVYCSDTAVAGIQIQDAPEAQFEIVSNACSNTVMVSSLSKNANRFEWNFGDSSSAYNTKFGNTASHTYSANGTYNIQLIAFNLAGYADTIVLPVIVTNANGLNKANFTYNNGLCNCRCQNLVRFKNLTPGTNTYLWSFGDGASSVLPNTSKGFPGSGYYQVTLTAVDSVGCMSTITKTVEIDPSVSGPSASFNTDYQVQCLATNNFNFYNTSSYMGQGWINKYYWYFGDGTMDSSNTFIYNKKYTSAGNYVVTLIAVGAEGCRDTMSMYIQVRSLPCSGVLKFVNLQDGSNWHIDPKLGDGGILNAIKTVEEDIQYSLYPNPNLGNFCIQFKELMHEPITITIVDVLGKQVYQKLHNQVGINLIQLEMEYLNDGTYMLFISSDSHQYRDQKFIVIH